MTKEIKLSDALIYSSYDTKEKEDINKKLDFFKNEEIFYDPQESIFICKRLNTVYHKSIPYQIPILFYFSKYYTRNGPDIYFSKTDKEFIKVNPKSHDILDPELLLLKYRDFCVWNSPIGLQNIEKWYLDQFSTNFPVYNDKEAMKNNIQNIIGPCLLDVNTLYKVIREKKNCSRIIIPSCNIKLENDNHLRKLIKKDVLNYIQKELEVTTNFYVNEQLKIKNLFQQTNSSISAINKENANLKSMNEDIKSFLYKQKQLKEKLYPQGKLNNNSFLEYLKNYLHDDKLFEIMQKIESEEQYLLIFKEILKKQDFTDLSTIIHDFREETKEIFWEKYRIKKKLKGNH